MFHRQSGVRGTCCHKPETAREWAQGFSTDSFLLLYDVISWSSLVLNSERDRILQHVAHIQMFGKVEIMSHMSS